MTAFGEYCEACGWDISSPADYDAYLEGIDRWTSGTVDLPVSGENPSRSFPYHFPCFQAASEWAKGDPNRRIITPQAHVGFAGCVIANTNESENPGAGCERSSRHESEHLIRIGCDVPA